MFINATYSRFLLPREKKKDYNGKRNEHYWIKGEGTKTEMNVFILPYGLLCKYNSTYTHLY